MKMNRSGRIYRGGGTVLVKTEILYPDFSDSEEPIKTEISSFCEKIVSLAFDYAESDLYETALKSLSEEKNRFRFREYLYKIRINADESDSEIELSAVISLSRGADIISSRSAVYDFDRVTGLIIPAEKRRKNKHRRND